MKTNETNSYVSWRAEKRIFLLATVPGCVSAFIMVVNRKRIADYVKLPQISEYPTRKSPSLSPPPCPPPFLEKAILLEYPASRLVTDGSYYFMWKSMRNAEKEMCGLLFGNLAINKYSSCVRQSSNSPIMGPAASVFSLGSS